MSKIICDVCGTSYPETATQCPICGCVRPADVVTLNIDADSNEAQNKGSYTYVKGGRFSKTNVKKRNSTGSNSQVETDQQPDEPQQEKGKGDKGLIIAVCVLLVAIVAVVIYIVMHFFGPGQSQGDIGALNTTDNTAVLNTGNATEDLADPTEEETIIRSPCEDIMLPNAVVEFDKAGAAHLLSYTTEPELTSDPVYFSSSDESVATINENGKIVAVGAGQAIITVRCGEIEKECRVVCTFDAQSTEPSTEPTDETTAPTTDTDTNEIVLKLNYSLTMRDDPNVGDVSMAVGTTWTAYLDRENEIPSTEVTFTSSDPAVLTISKTGVVTAVGAGQAMITAEYQGQKVKCRVIVN